MDRHARTGHPLLIASAAVAVYWLWAALLVWQNPGLQYDEALLVSGAVHMLRSPAELTIPHDPDTWACVPGRCFPLMSVRYVGPIKDYICLPLFAVFGVHTFIIRLVSVLLGSIGIFGFALLIAEHVGPVAGACVGLALAINPTYSDLTVFDNNAVAPMMAGAGLVCLAVSRYLNAPGTLAALGIGAAMGFSVWARANTVWFLMAVCGAAIVVLNRRLLSVPGKHWLAWIGGGVLGGLPFLLYQVHSRGGTWQGLEIFANHQPWTEQLYYRFVLFSEMLMSDREHRAMWDGPMMPDWQRWLWPAILLIACVVPWVRRAGDVWARFGSVAVILLTGALFASRLALSEHHLVAVLPIAVVAAVLAGLRIARRLPMGGVGQDGILRGTGSPAVATGNSSRLANKMRESGIDNPAQVANLPHKWVMAGVAILYVGCAVFWQVSAVRGLAETGGVGPWSDGIYTLAKTVETRHLGRLIRVLDWGLLDNLYVLTQGRLHAVENFGWPQDIAQGGLFLTNAAGSSHFPEASIGFRKALETTQVPVRRHIFQQRSGAPFAELFDVGDMVQLSLTQPTAANQLTGFHGIEETGWRWTQRRFGMTLPPPAENMRAGARLTLRIYVPQPVITAFHTLTLSASVNGHSLGAATYDKAGKQEFAASLPAGWVNPRSNRFEFSLDHALAPSQTDRRELGVIVAGASLQTEFP